MKRVNLTRRERAASKPPGRPKVAVRQAEKNASLEEQFEAAALEPGSLILPLLKGESQLPQRRQDKLRRQRAFLEMVREGATVAEACVEVKITRTAFQFWLSNDNYFGVAFGAAKEDRTDRVEASVFDLATKGEKRSIASGGRVVAVDHVRDVKAAELYLKAHRPGVYGDKRQIEVSGQIQFSKPELSVELIKEVLRSVDFSTLPPWQQDPIDIEALPAPVVADEAPEGSVQ